MLTQTEKDLITLLKSFGLDKDTTVAISVLSKTDEIRQKLINAIIARYDEKGEVAEQDIQKMLVMLTCKKKPSSTNSTKTEAGMEQ